MSTYLPDPHPVFQSHTTRRSSPTTIWSPKPEQKASLDFVPSSSSMPIGSMRNFFSSSSSSPSCGIGAEPMQSSRRSKILESARGYAPLACSSRISSATSSTDLGAPFRKQRRLASSKTEWFARPA
uniref:Uncharacterized protein n=1 Tax=uncultured marine virus TaxID=186617 RepID=A0A0F7L3B6_9VIRU|nr:hypothetical protein [uncultured marine virus]